MNDTPQRRVRHKKCSPKSQLLAQAKYASACHDMTLLITNIQAQGRTAHALICARAWEYFKGNQSEDCMVRIWVKDEFRSLFTVSIHNKILSMLRKHYDTVVLLKFTLIDSNGIVSEEKERDI